MKRKRFTEEQIISILKDAESGVTVANLSRKHGISEGTFYRWKAKFGGMDISDAKRLKQTEEENRRLKRIVADQALDIQMLKEVNSTKLVTPAAQRRAVNHLQGMFQVSCRRVCGLLGLHCSTYHYSDRRIAQMRHWQRPCGPRPSAGDAGAIGVFCCC